MPEDEATKTDPPGTGTSSWVFPDTSTLSGEGQAWKKISVVRFGQVFKEVTLPASSSHSVFVNVGPPYALEEKLEGRVYRTCGMRGDVAVVPAGVPIERIGTALLWELENEGLLGGVFADSLATSLAVTKWRNRREWTLLHFRVLRVCTLGCLRCALCPMRPELPSVRLPALLYVPCLVLG